MSKLLVLVIAVSALATEVWTKPHHEISEEDKKIRDNCAAEHGIDVNQIGLLLKTHDPKLNCFHGCIWQQNGVISSDLKVDVELAKTKIAGYFHNTELRDGVIRAFETCHEELKEETFDDLCDMAEKYIKCKHDKIKEMNLDVLKDGKMDNCDENEEDKEDEKKKDDE